MSDEYEGMTVAQALQAERVSEAEEIIDPEAEIPEIEDVKENLRIGDGVDPLKALLEVDPNLPPTTDVYIARLGTSFTVQGITDEDKYDKMVERCTSYVRNRRGGGRIREVDGRRLARLTVAEFTVTPNFKPGSESFSALSEKYKTKEAESLVGKALLIGEIDKLADAILTISGFDEEVDNAGN